MDDIGRVQILNGAKNFVKHVLQIVFLQMKLVDQGPEVSLSRLHDHEHRMRFTSNCFFFSANYLNALSEKRWEILGLNRRFQKVEDDQLAVGLDHLVLVLKVDLHMLDSNELAAVSVATFNHDSEGSLS